MTRYSQIKRWEILISLLRRKPFLSKKDLIAILEEDYGIAISVRTFERDLSDLGSEMGIFITYCHQQKGYHITRENEDQVISFLQFAGRIFLGDLFRDALKDFKDLTDQVKPEDYSFYEGVNHLQPILLALRNRLKISFIHENFQRNTRTPYQITPFQLREYDRRWYVVGIPDGEDHIKTFGLSRISGLKTLGLASLQPEDFSEQLKKFDRVIGLNYDAHDKAEIIRLAVSPRQYKYLKTLPLHKSQEKESKLPDGRIEVSLFVIPNYELKMQLLKLGDQIEVLEPEFLRKKIKETLTSTLTQYQ